MDTRWATSPGIALMGADVPSRVTAWARAAEAAGFGSAWIIEDYFQPGAYALAAAAAAVTERLAIGLGSSTPTRVTAPLAMERPALPASRPAASCSGSARATGTIERWDPLGAPRRPRGPSRSSGACRGGAGHLAARFHGG
jgi:hypothetical protein